MINEAQTMEEYKAALDNEYHSGYVGNSVSIHAKYLRENRWDIFARAIELLAQNADDEKSFVISAGALIGKYCKKIPNSTSTIPYDISGLSALAHSSDNRVYFQRKGNEFIIVEENKECKP